MRLCIRRLKIYYKCIGLGPRTLCQGHRRALFLFMARTHLKACQEGLKGPHLPERPPNPTLFVYISGNPFTEGESALLKVTRHTDIEP